MFGAREPTQINPHLRNKAHRRHCLHTWMCHQELYRLLIGFHLRFDLSENLLHGGLQKPQMGKDPLKQHLVMGLDPTFQSCLQLREFASQGSSR